MTLSLSLLRAGKLMAMLHHSHPHHKLLSYKTLRLLRQSSSFSSSASDHCLARTHATRFRDQKKATRSYFCSERAKDSTFEEEEELKVEADERLEGNGDEKEDKFKVKYKGEEEEEEEEEEKFFNYGEPLFWDTTYAKESEPLEWYQSYGDMAPIVRRYIPLSSHILMAGCGNAEMSEHMIKDGFNDIVNIDNSSIVIEAMQKKYHNIPQLKYLAMDVSKLSFDDDSFDSVIDKGTLDAIMCVAGGPYSVPLMIAEINRILKPGGVYMLITTGDPKSRLPLLNASVFHWIITLYVIPKPVSKTAIKGCPEAYSEAVSFNPDGTYETKHVSEKEDQLFVFICIKP